MKSSSEAENGRPLGALTLAVVRSAEDIRTFGDLTAVLPLPIQEEVFVRDEPHGLQPSPQFQEHHLRFRLTCVF